MNKQTELICLFKNQNDNTFSQSNRASKNSIKCQLSFENFQLHQITELQIKTSPKRTDFSYCLAHKLSFNMNKLFKINLMVASFNTFDNPESIYLYENNIPGQQTVFSYNHKGIHWYVMLQTKSIKDLIFWFRFATSTYAQEQSFGSGLDAITGVRKSTLSTGVKWKL